MPRAAATATGAALLPILCLAGAVLGAAGLARASGSPGAAAYQDGPLPQMTGGFGEQTCRQCHLDNPVNAPGGSLRLEGLPAAYEPNREYTLVLVLQREGLKRAGFELSVRTAAGASAGEQAGRLRIADPRTQIVLAPGTPVQYIQHTLAGSTVSTPGEGRWTVHWTAPGGQSGPVAFHVAGNAANDDASPLGDFVYTSATVIEPR
jgi:hypothetical protein